MHRFGPGRAVLGGAFSRRRWGSPASASGCRRPSVAVVAPGLVLVGLGMGVWDVAMNVQGADVERRLGRSLMPRLHAAFSLGTVAGAGVGAAVGRGRRPARRAGRGHGRRRCWLDRRGAGAFLPPHVAEPDEERPPLAACCAAWREPRTLLSGLLVLGFAFTEGSANDWMAVAMVDGYGTSETVGAVGFGVFVTAMTDRAGCRRLAALERFGRVATLRGDRRCRAGRAAAGAARRVGARSRWPGRCSGGWVPRSASRSG